jgi:hypothetical protein
MNTIYTFSDSKKPFDINDLNELVYDFMEKGIPLAPMVKYPIYIPSKGRAHLNTASAVLDKSGVTYKLVVEPQDYDAYCNVYSSDRVIQMDKNNQGLAYVRNYIKKYSRDRGEEKHWQVDDDIKGFKIRKRDADKNEKVEALTCLSIVEHCTDMFSNVAISGINPDRFAFDRKFAVRKNKLTCQCVLIDNNINGEWAFGGLEDWHYTLSVLENGYCTLAFDHLMTYSPPPGKVSGGCTDIHYSDTVWKPVLEQFSRLWFGKFRIQEQPNSPKRWRLKPARRFFTDYKQNLIPKK